MNIAASAPTTPCTESSWDYTVLLVQYSIHLRVQLRVKPLGMLLTVKRTAGYLITFNNVFAPAWGEYKWAKGVTTF